MEYKEIFFSHPATGKETKMLTRADKSYSLRNNLLFIIGELSENREGCFSSRDYLMTALMAASNRSSLTKPGFYYVLRTLIDSGFVKKVNNKGTLALTQQGQLEIVQLGGTPINGYQYEEAKAVGLFESIKGTPWWEHLDEFQGAHFRGVLSKHGLDPDAVFEDMTEEFSLSIQAYQLSGKPIPSIKAFKALYIRDYIWDRFNIDLSRVYKGKSFIDFGFDNKYTILKSKEKAIQSGSTWIKLLTKKGQEWLKMAFKGCDKDINQLNQFMYNKYCLANYNKEGMTIYMEELLKAVLISVYGFNFNNHNLSMITDKDLKDINTLKAYDLKSINENIEQNKKDSN